MLFIRNEEADPFLHDIVREGYNCNTTLISSRPENERNKVGSSAQFSRIFSKDK
jgi:hypothetical protein